jgi:hypothetical protein
MDKEVVVKKMLQGRQGMLFLPVYHLKRIFALTENLKSR